VANPTSVPETGGNVDFTFTITNTSASESVTITHLLDDKFPLLVKGSPTCQVGTVLTPGALCSFTETLPVPAGDASGTHVNTFTAKAKDNENNEVSDSDPETVTYTNVPPVIEVTKTAYPTSLPETGGNVVFT